MHGWPAWQPQGCTVRKLTRHSDRALPVLVTLSSSCLSAVTHGDHRPSPWQQQSPGSAEPRSHLTFVASTLDTEGDRVRDQVGCQEGPVGAGQEPAVGRQGQWAPACQWLSLGLSFPIHSPSVVSRLCIQAWPLTMRTVVWLDESSVLIPVAGD